MHTRQFAAALLSSCAILWELLAVATAAGSALNVMLPPCPRIQLNRTSKTLHRDHAFFASDRSNPMPPISILPKQHASPERNPRVSLPQCIVDVHNMRARRQDVHTDRELCLFFMPDPRFMRQQSQRSVCTSWLRALMLWTSFNTLRKGHVDSRKISPYRLSVDPVSLFLTDERSDAAVVGSGNKAMGKSSLLTF